FASSKYGCGASEQLNENASRGSVAVTAPSTAPGSSVVSGSPSTAGVWGPSARVLPTSLRDCSYASIVLLEWPHNAVQSKSSTEVINERLKCTERLIYRI